MFLGNILVHAGAYWLGGDTDALCVTFWSSELMTLQEKITKPLIKVKKSYYADGGNSSIERGKESEMQ